MQRLQHRLSLVVATAFLAALLLALEAFGDITVYVTKTGKKYHTATCSSLRYSAIPMSLLQAAQRYGPCSRCNPAVPGSSQGPRKSHTSMQPRQAPKGAQCRAITKKGSQCLRSARSGSIYCWQHGG